MKKTHNVDSLPSLPTGEVVYTSKVDAQCLNNRGAIKQAPKGSTGWANIRGQLVQCFSAGAGSWKLPSTSTA